ncbi:adenosylcobinamide-GDP ribazoletransferase [Gloeomargarita lithophora]|uniref:adenosylcobinamide-GDP ribazoletransferase n=1 Tax=Gloeomargarita lithophora TaxID=1188228 RepID=UPI003525BEA9
MATGTIAPVGLGGTLVENDRSNCRSLGLDRLGIGLSPGRGGGVHWRLGGHTGDTYGAVVEWVETLCWCAMTRFVSG